MGTQAQWSHALKRGHEIYKSVKGKQGFGNAPAINKKISKAYNKKTGTFNESYFRSMISGGSKKKKLSKKERIFKRLKKKASKGGATLAGAGLIY